MNLLCLQLVSVQDMNLLCLQLVSTRYELITLTSGEYIIPTYHSYSW